MQGITSLSNRVDIGSPESVLQLVYLLGQTKHPYLDSHCANVLRSMFSRISSHPATQDSSFVSLGHCWVAFSRLVIELYIPDAPVDPSAMQRCTEEFWQSAESVTFAQTQLHRALEQRVTGNRTNKVIDYLDSEMGPIQERLTAVSAIPRREKREIGKLKTYWSEVSQFLDQVISAPKLDALSSTSDSQDGSKLLRERVLQESITGFCQRLETAYPEYDDINAPLTWGLYHMKFGIQLAMEERETVGTALAQSLTAFPSMLCADSISSSFGKQDGTIISAFSPISLSLHAISYTVSTGVDIRDLIPVLAHVYDQAVGLWLFDRAREEELSKISNSLYRGNTSTGDYVDAAQEEAEFLELFPDFDSTLDADSPSKRPADSTHTTLLHPSHTRELFQLHHQIMSARVDPRVTQVFQGVRREAVFAIMKSHFAELPDSLDQTALHFQSAMLQDRVSSLKQSSNISGKSYNFYHDPNVPEVNRATIVIQSLRKRIDTLILEWPDQMVLQHLGERCDTILLLHLNSPVAHVLAALEQLLLQSEDWEMYANRQNSLTTHRRELINLIVDWRRMELSCWSVLLEREAQSFAEGASEWWLQLYEALVRGYSAAVEESSRDELALDQYLDGLVPLLDGFMSKSTLGQFAARIQLAEDFEVYVGHLISANHSSSSPPFGRVRRILYNTRQYYAQFSSTLSAHLSKQRAALEKDIQGYIKLASWKDINVQALKASAQRTHHHLYKCIRKFRDILRQPITTHLNPPRAGDSEQKQGQYVAIPLPSLIYESSFPVSTSVAYTRPAHLANIERTFSRFNNLVTRDLMPFIHSSSPNHVDDFAVSLILTASDLAKETVSNTLTKEKRQKHLKALLVRKKKACSDLLKEFKRAGISSNVRPEVVRDHENQRWMREQPIIATNPGGKMLNQKGDLYLNRLFGLLPELRPDAASHHQDITTRELQRGIALLDSGVSLALRNRTR